MSDSETEGAQAREKRRWEIDCGGCGSDYFHVTYEEPQFCAHCGSYCIRTEEVDW